SKRDWSSDVCSSDLTEEDLASDETLNKEYSVLADRDLRRNGYTIHTTIDKDIYNKAQEIVKNFQEYGPDTYEIDEDTGEEIPKRSEERREGKERRNR